MEDKLYAARLKATSTSTSDYMYLIEESITTIEPSYDSPSDTSSGASQLSEVSSTTETTSNKQFAINTDTSDSTDVSHITTIHASDSTDVSHDTTTFTSDFTDDPHNTSVHTLDSTDVSHKATIDTSAFTDVSHITSTHALDSTDVSHNTKGSPSTEVSNFATTEDSTYTKNPNKGIEVTDDSKRPQINNNNWIPTVQSPDWTTSSQARAGHLENHASRSGASFGALAAIPVLLIIGAILVVFWYYKKHNKEPISRGNGPSPLEYPACALNSPTEELRFRMLNSTLGCTQRRAIIPISSPLELIPNSQQQYPETSIPIAIDNSTPSKGHISFEDSLNEEYVYDGVVRRSRDSMDGYLRGDSCWSEYIDFTSDEDDN